MCRRWTDHLIRRQQPPTCLRRTERLAPPPMTASMSPAERARVELADASTPLPPRHAPKAIRIRCGTEPILPADPRLSTVDVDLGGCAVLSGAGRVAGAERRRLTWPPVACWRSGRGRTSVGPRPQHSGPRRTWGAGHAFRSADGRNRSGGPDPRRCCRRVHRFRSQGCERPGAGDGAAPTGGHDRRRRRGAALRRLVRTVRGGCGSPCPADPARAAAVRRRPPPIRLRQPSPGGSRTRGGATGSCRSCRGTCWRARTATPR
jgi:hypothetical protein